MAEILIPVAVGELVDRISILWIKFERIRDPQKSVHVRFELEALNRTARSAGLDVGALVAELTPINIAIWDAEETCRACEAAGEFGKEFVEVARSIYRNNDLRATIKRRINLDCGSRIVEEKSY